MNTSLPTTPLGIFAVYKPRGMTSQRAVQIVKRWAREKTGQKNIKVGHGGTLDPLAEGLLIIAIGREYTKQINHYVDARKEYRAHITLGATSTTDDAEGEKTITQRETVPDYPALEHCLAQFTGEIVQVPPVYSAIKIKGQEAYKRVRRGEVVEMKSRRVHIYHITLHAYTYPHIDLSVVCSKGTYIRSLARDIGQALGTGGYLCGLLRTRIGSISADEAISVSAFTQAR